VDIRKFYDTLDHAHLRDLLQLRVRDGVLLRLIGKWLNAGVLEDGSIVSFHFELSQFFHSGRPVESRSLFIWPRLVW
jgi:hypothetical protein